MATFTEKEKNQICTILQINMILLNKQLMYVTHYITDEVVLQVKDRIAIWYDDGIGDDFVSVDPNTANFGARIDPELARENIRQEICNLMLFDGDDIGGSGDSFTIVRG